MRRLISLVPLALAACVPWLSPDPSWVEFPARLEFYGNPAVIGTPTTAPRGTTFNVTFTTYGGGCIEPAQNRLVVAGLDVHIYSTQRELRGEDVACTEELRFEENVVPVRVVASGTATVNVHGRRLPSDEAIVLTRSVTITP